MLSLVLDVLRNEMSKKTYKDNSPTEMMTTSEKRRKNSATFVTDMVWFNAIGTDAHIKGMS